MNTLLLRLGFIALVSAPLIALGGPRDAQWRQVDDAARQGKPKTAIDRLEPIIAAALADGSHAEAIKAIGRKIALEGQIQGNKAEEKISRLQTELEKAPAPMKPVMEALLAHWCWEFFQQNRGRFRARTPTASAPGADLATWELPRIVDEIDRHFTAALANESALKATPIREFDDLLDRGNVPDVYRPTLFDFLAHQALRFYQTGERGGLAPEETFEIDAAGPIFSSTADFIAWTLPNAVPASAQRKAVELYQNLLRFHANDTDRSAWLDADFARLNYGRNVALGDTKDARYQAALEAFIAANPRHEISARALATLAELFLAQDDPAQGRALAQRGLAAFPASSGGAQCANLIRQIEAPFASLSTERVWNAPRPTLDLTYRNVTKVYFRAVPVDFNAYVARARWNFGGLGNERAQLLAARPTLEWSAELPPTSDFRSRTEQIATPASLPAGFYFIVASHNAAFSTTDNQVSAAPIWVSHLALVLRTRFDGVTASGLVLAADSGEPIRGATVQLWRRDREGWLKPIAPATTDANGLFPIPADGDGAIVALAEHDGEAVSSTHDVFVREIPNRAQPEADTVFFTDRAIYRPGQTVYYKGVSASFDQAGGNYTVLAGRKVTVLFKDPNGQEIARADHLTNDYGSFNGVFTAPRDRLTGRMRLQVAEGRGVTAFNVEEYKRPKFQVKLEPPAAAAKLGERVSLTGKGLAYTGAAIGGAKVSWRVERSVQLPAWSWWWEPPPTKALAHSTGRTEADGTFKIEFPAEPDRTVPAANEPVFVFNVYADVTDATGETQSVHRVVRGGYTALQARLTLDEWQTTGAPVGFSIVTTSLDGDPQPAAGTLTIHALRSPSAVSTGPLEPGRQWNRSRSDEPKNDPTNPDSWELGAVVTTNTFTTDAAGKTTVLAPLEAGIYRALLETTDRFGRKVTARSTVQVVDPAADRYRLKLPNHFSAPKWSVEPGETFSALWGTGYDRGRALVELECNGRVLQRYWTADNRTQSAIEQPVTESMRGGFTVRVTYLRENRAYFNEHIVQVPWSNKQLAVKWETFRSKLKPGEKETWTAIVTGPDAQRAAVEMVAALYDASLDALIPHDWPHGFAGFRSERSWVRSELQNTTNGFQTLARWRPPVRREVSWHYRSFPSELTGINVFPDGAVVLSPFEVRTESDLGYVAANTLAGPPLSSKMSDVAGAISVVTAQELAGPASVPPDPSPIAARKNLNETAFFFPQLLSGSDGVVKLVFTMPEALTEWKFLGFVHDKQLRSGAISDRVVTAKELMVVPNPPRFVREGDAVEFTVKVSNQSEASQTGRVRLTFADASSEASLDAALANRTTEQAFDVPAKESRTFSWRIAVPDGLGVLAYKAVASSARFSDGEEGYLPVLSRRVLVTESLPLALRGPGTKEFEFKKLLESGGSDTLRHQSLTVQMSSQPAWYAVLALPYLMEFPYDCSEQIFNRFYANALARHLARSDPKIRQVFDLWKNTPALESPMEKNQELKSVMLEETPWLRQAQAESQARKNLGVLFDQNRLDEEASGVLRTLADRQLSEGLWPWFPGGRPSEYISLYIMTGFGRLRHLGVEVDPALALKSIDSLDAWMERTYREILRQPDPQHYVPSPTVALYLYGRSFFLEDHAVPAAHRPALDFFLQQARQHWLASGQRQTQAHLALALQRFGDQRSALAIVASLKERSVRTEEAGRFWRDQEAGWWWFRAPIETQALMIEAFAEIADDASAVEDCKVWLLQQKRTQDWKTTKATADAIYGLMLRGEKLLSRQAAVEVALAGAPIQPGKIEAGTGFFERKFSAADTKPAKGRVSAKKSDDGISWGSVHWQYLEDVAKLTPHDGTPLTLTKTLWVKATSARGQVLKPVTGPLAVGDELVVRLELRADQDMEFVHLKDQRGSGTEPVNVLSQYRFRGGLAYFESTRDAGSHFFIDYLPKGTHVFEYSTRVQLRGEYQSGIAEIQCMYAPEFNAHSASTRLEVR